MYTYVIKECFCFKTLTILDEYCLDNINEYNVKYVNNINYIFLPSESLKKKVSFELRHLWGCVFFIQRILRNGRLYHP